MHILDDHVTITQLARVVLQLCSLGFSREDENPKIAAFWRSTLFLHSPGNLIPYISVHFNPNLILPCSPFEAAHLSIASGLSVVAPKSSDAEKEMC